MRSTRREVDDAPARVVLCLALEHHDALTTGTCPDVLRRGADLLAASRDLGTPIPSAAAWRFAAAHHSRGEFALAITWCEAADRAEGSIADRALLAATEASARWARGDADVDATAEAALDLARESGDDAALAHAWTARALAHVLVGDRDDSRSAFEAALDHARHTGGHALEIRALSNLGSMSNQAGRHVQALAHLDEACLLAELHDGGLLGAIANINRSEALVCLGRLDEALAEVTTARDLCRRAGSPMLPVALLAEGEVHRHRGNAVRAAAAYREAVDRAEATGNVRVLADALAGLARTTVLDAPDQAASYAERALDQPSAIGHLVAVLATGWIALATNDHDSAAAAADRAIVEAGRRQSLPELADALELRALAHADDAAADADLAEAAGIWRESGNAIRTEVNRAVRARRAGDRGTEGAARHNLQALGARVDLYRIAGPLQAIGRLRQPDVQIQTLGTFRVVVDGAPVPPSSWPSRKSRELIKILASRSGRPVRREVLAELLWPDVLDTSNRLSVALSTARGALDPQRAHPADHHVVADRDQVHLDLDTVSLDLDEFERTATSAVGAAERGDADAISLLQAAASLYPAPFLADEPAPEWAFEVRGELDALAARVKRTLAELLLAEDAVDRAIPWLHALVADDPYDESAQLSLISALHEAGRHGEARRAHGGYAAAMAELDLEPTPLSSLLRRAEPRAETREEASPDAALAPRAALPPATPLIGRESELAQVLDLLADRRCVTITGAGGVGKTHLALVAAAGFAEDVSTAWFVDLSAIDGPPEQAIATALGVAEDTAQPLATTLVDHLRPLAALLVLDNCEHLLGHLHPLVERLLAECTDLRVLLTSHERLGLPDERAVVLSGLASRTPAGDSAGAAAELFLARVREAEPEFSADPAKVAEVCERCDGLPLAIELAAARCAALGIDGLLAGLDDRLRFLTGPARRTGRHRSVRAVLDWSHDLLAPDEQRIFQRLGCFAGAFDLAAAVAVAGAGAGLSAASVTDVVGRLSEKHLLERQDNRWRMLDLVRSYARDRLHASGDAAAVTAAHLAWAVALADDLAGRCASGDSWREEYDARAADLHAALSAGSGTADQRLALALALAALEEHRGGLTAARHAAETAVDIARATGDAEQLARAALGASLTGMLFGVTHGHRVALLGEALQSLDDRPSPLRARVLARLATELYWSKRREQCHDLAREAVAVATRVGDDGALAQALYAQHYVTRGAGTLDERRALAAGAVRSARLGGETQLELAGRAAHAVDLLEAGDLDGIAREVEALATAARRHGHPEFQWYAGTYRLVLALIRGETDLADELAAAAESNVAQDKEFGIGLLFALTVTDLRPGRDEDLARAQTELAMMSTRFPRVIVWRCALLLVDLARGTSPDTTGWARALAAEVLAMDRDDAHWLLAASMVAEGVAAIPEVAEQFAVPLEKALRPYADALAVGGRVAAFRGSVSHALGLLAAAHGDTDQAVADLTRAVEVHERIGALPFAERSRTALEQARG